MNRGGRLDVEREGEVPATAVAAGFVEHNPLPPAGEAERLIGAKHTGTEPGPHQPSVVGAYRVLGVSFGLPPVRWRRVASAGMADAPGPDGTTSSASAASETTEPNLRP